MEPADGHRGTVGPMPYWLTGDRRRRRLTHSNSGHEDGERSDDQPREMGHGRTAQKRRAA